VGCPLEARDENHARITYRGFSLGIRRKEERIRDIKWMRRGAMRELTVDRGCHHISRPLTGEGDPDWEQSHLSLLSLGPHESYEGVHRAQPATATAPYDAVPLPGKGGDEIFASGARTNERQQHDGQAGNIGTTPFPAVQGMTHRFPSRARTVWSGRWGDHQIARISTNLGSLPSGLPKGLTTNLHIKQSVNLTTLVVEATGTLDKPNTHLLLYCSRSSLNFNASDGIHRHELHQPQSGRTPGQEPQSPHDDSHSAL
jgi:hypothetical protein